MDPLSLGTAILLGGIGALFAWGGSDAQGTEGAPPLEGFGRIPKGPPIPPDKIAWRDAAEEELTAKLNADNPGQHVPFVAFDGSRFLAVFGGCVMSARAGVPATWKGYPVETQQEGIMSAVRPARGYLPGSVARTIYDQAVRELRKSRTTFTTSEERLMSQILERDEEGPADWSVLREEEGILEISAPATAKETVKQALDRAYADTELEAGAAAMQHVAFVEHRDSPGAVGEGWSVRLASAVS